MKIDIWDTHIKTDFVRNKVIIPEIINFITKIKPSSVLDVGSGSGYIGDKIRKEIDQKIKLDCIEINKKNILYAEKKYNQEGNIHFINGDYFNYELKEKYDLILFLYTLVDFAYSVQHSEKIFNDLTPNGFTTIVLPDYLVDIHNEGKDILSEYIKKTFNFPSKDISSRYNVPFFFNRIERVIEYTLRAGLILIDMKRFEYEKDKAVFILYFQNQKRMQP